MLTSGQRKDVDELRALAAQNFQFPARYACLVSLEFPLGELVAAGPCTDALRLYAARQGARPTAIAKRDRFATQGLEGKISLRLPYSDALILADQMEPYRVQIRTAE